MDIQLVKMSIWLDGRKADDFRIKFSHKDDTTGE